MEPLESQTVPTSDPPPKSRRRKIIIALLLLFLLVGGAAALWYVNNPPKLANRQTSKANTSSPPKTKPAKDLALARFITPTTGEIWLDTQKKLPDLQYFIDYDGQPSPASYYEVGKRQDNIIILGVAEYGVGSTNVLFEKTPAGVVTAILQPDKETTYNQDDAAVFGEIIKAGISKDTSTRYDSLSVPRKLDLDKGQIVSKSPYPTIGEVIQADASVGNTASQVRKIGQSILMKGEVGYADTKLTSIGYYLKSPINTRIDLVYEPLETDLAKYQWSSGASPQDKLRPIARGCGGVGSSVTRSDEVTDADTQLVGKSPSGQKVYQLKDPNHALWQKAYDEFKEFSAYDTEAGATPVSKEEFVKQHAVVLYKDAFGQWLVYAREQFSPAYGCAKPVVYLYPTSRQHITVKIGADVKLSDPFYDPRTGWQVTAYPNGQLVHEDNSYSSLFWEGPGWGQYPAVTSGTIVKTSDAITTIRKQLRQQGLSQTESNDFIDYWQDKLPSKPYTRLTWFNTEQLNQLAPLSITPRPDSIIRVFLDFSGLDRPIDLPAQDLKSIPRTGFSVIEWGGLSPKKLY